MVTADIAAIATQGSGHSVSAEKGGYERFMQKEIFEQPRAIMDTIGTRVSDAEAYLDLGGIDLSPKTAAGIRRLYLVACGTAYYSCMVGKYLFEQLASRDRLPFAGHERA